MLGRRDFLAAALASQVDYRDYPRTLPDYLTRLARQAYEQRNAALRACATPAQFRARQAWARSTFTRLTGLNRPANSTPPRVETQGSLDRPGYRVDKIRYESRPGFWISANLYLPQAGSAPYPAVLFQCGHSLIGKAADVYQYCCQGLAQLGFVVLSFDPMGQGERRWYPQFTSADDEHTHAGRQLILAGETATSMQTLDAIRSLDVLESHPLVDKKRLASTGNSGGGTTTMFLAAVDDRLAAAVASCPNSENYACANYTAPGSVDDAEQDFLLAGPLGFDRWDLFYPLAPKPLKIVLSAKDFFGTYSPRYLESGREEFAKLQRAYTALGAPTNLGWYETPIPHGLSHDLRLQIYEWLRRHLQGVTAPLVEEPPVRAESEADLRVGLPAGSLTPQQIAQAIAPPTPQPLPDLEKLLAFEKPVARVVVKGTAPSRGLKIEALDIESTPGIFLPAWRFVPSQPKSGPPIVLVQPGGRNAQWAEGGLCQNLALRGRTVVTADLRGIGDLRPRGYVDETYAWASQMLGRPLLGQRVTDLIAAIRIAGSPVDLAASGAMTVPAIFAAALDPTRIRRLHLNAGLASFRSLLDSPDYSEPFANFLFDILRHTDLPQLLAAIAARGVAIHRGWNLDSLTLE